MTCDSFWWPKMNNNVEDLIKTCLPCQAVTPSSQIAPLNPIYMPSHPWEYLYVDICVPFPKGEYIFTVIDAYSRYPEAALLKETSSKSLIKESESILSRHGYPLTLKTDNDPNLVSVEMENYLRSKWIHHAKSATYRPRSKEVEYYSTAEIDTSNSWKR